MKKGFHVDVVQEHLEKEAEVGFQFWLIQILFNPSEKKLLVSFQYFLKRSNK